MYTCFVRCKVAATADGQWPWFHGPEHTGQLVWAVLSAVHDQPRSLRQEVGLEAEVKRRPALLNTVQELQSLDAVEFCAGKCLPVKHT